MSKVQMIPVKKGEDVSTYRYKMPKIVPRPISSGNGVKSAVLNANDIAKAIFRTPVALTQWFGYALVTQAKYQPTNGQIVLNGGHDPKKLQESVYEFIDNFVLCPVCSNPETTLSKSGNPPTLMSSCSACGSRSPIGLTKSSYYDKMNQWFVSHIQTETKTTHSVTTATKGVVDTIDDFQRASTENDDSQGVYISVDELAAIEKQLEPSEEKREKKKQTEQEFEAFMDKLKQMIHSPATDAEIYSFYTKTADDLEWPTAPRCGMIFESVFHGHKADMLKLIEGRRGLLLRFVMDEDAEKAMLGYTCQFIELPDNQDLMTSAPIIFHTLFDNEIITQQTFTDWFTNKPVSRYERNKKAAAELRKQVDIFMTWLKEAPMEAEQEPDQEEDEGDEEEQENIEDL